MISPWICRDCQKRECAPGVTTETRGAKIWSRSLFCLECREIRDSGPRDGLPVARVVLRRRP